ncbi:hypothetical protein PaecuDRAFT_2481 [Paenibacillus curdlanolyticus YK9]|uniref:ComX pheromone n=1 Tax=Paenibacillus curdlanolyticus YK9 TaxID=717606 RepID=E0I9Z4_9BACL|nr:competence pheromone ComX [Paenibacillus curdlanolyticus]EFM10571.1 hypothetical protein PaecuDRAFT_2481 [Paenibacillus curdlanolyticus YK9]
MIKNVIAQLKQSPEMMSQFLQGRLVPAGVSATEHQVMIEIMRAQKSPEDKLNRGQYWWD